MKQKQDEKDMLLCTHGDCQEPHTEDGEYCEKHYPTRKQIRICALWHEGLGVSRTKVIFKEGGRYNHDGKEYGYWMNREVYNAIPLMDEATPDDYRKFGKVDEALDTDIYSLK